MKPTPTRARVLFRTLGLPGSARLFLGAFFLAGGAAPAFGQQPSPVTPKEAERLSLKEAVLLARVNNPQFLRTEDAVNVANWRVREANAAFLPTVTTSASLNYAGEGQQLIGNLTGDDLGAGSTDYFLSGYSLGVGYSLSGATFYALRSSRADRRAAEARVGAEAYDLDSRVTIQYLHALRATEAMEAAQRQLARAEENLELAQARFEAGAVPGTDTRQAEVERGRAAVAVIRAEADARASEARLKEEMGLFTTGPLELTTRFEVFEPGLALDELITASLVTHPRLRSYRESERAREANLREAQSSYLPTVTLGAFWSGFSRQIGNERFLLASARSSAESQQGNCELFNGISAGLSSPLEGYPQDCERFTLTSADEDRILSSNQVFPFEFQAQPFELSMRVSIPVFQGLARRRAVEEASVSVRASVHARRSEELRLQTEVTTAHGTLLAALEVAEIEERNVELAAEQLELAQQRYGLGAAPFLELLDAQSSVAIADRDYLNAVYDFHGAWVELQRASGMDLGAGGLGG